MFGAGLAFKIGCSCGRARPNPIRARFIRASRSFWLDNEENVGIAVAIMAVAQLFWQNPPAKRAGRTIFKVNL